MKYPLDKTIITDKYLSHSDTKIKNNQQEQTQEHFAIFFNSPYLYPFQIKTKIEIKQSQNKDTICIVDGQILKTDCNDDNSNFPAVVTNLNQMKYLRWQGQYGQNLKKIGKWNAFWKGELIKNVGGQYSQDGEKQGEWKEIINKQSNSVESYEVGIYQNNKRIGIWKFCFVNKEICNGSYNEQGLKFGRWVELSKNFDSYSQIVYEGFYDNNKKVGRWNILHRLNGLDKFKIIGGGLYNENGLKFGNWIELIPFYGDFNQVIQFGNYKNDKKIGRWDIKYQKKGKQSYSKIGGGSYDEQGLKSGIWIELNDNFGDYAQILFVGQYQQNVKIGRWDIYQGTKIKNTSNKIGGGLYDKQGQKYGLWEEISNNFFNTNEVKLQGQYKNNKRLGRWFFIMRNQQIGGGYYNEQGLKVGFWEDVSDIFQNYSQITYEGEYYDGKKVGSWNLIYFKEKIGGGYYNDQGLKNGKWIELGDNFKNNVQELENAEYKNGWKIGLQFERIAGFFDKFSFRFVKVYIQIQQ